jgi:hypothetical protein
MGHKRSLVSSSNFTSVLCYLWERIEGLLEKGWRFS